MNEEELKALVARARDAESAPSKPPPGLVEHARTAARHRGRGVGLAAGMAVAIVGLAGAVVLRPLGVDDARVVDETLSAVDIGELSAYGGPCPTVLPKPEDDSGHGFGTSTPAVDAPSLPTPDTAWICQYETQEIGRTDTGGTEYEWALHHPPRRIGDALLPQVTAGLNSIAVDDSGPHACTSDLGFRWMLVTSSGGDLTGVVVDGYGCRDVRLTDDPFVTAPGDPQNGGTVAGVLTAANGFADTLETWWDTSPADTDSGATPDELRVTCTDSGPRFESTAVAATPAGVVVVVDSTMSKGAYLTYTSDGLSGGDRIRRSPTSTTYAFPPGPVTLGCAAPPDMEETASLDIEVMDPYGYWRASTLADFGCSNGSQPSWIAVSGQGPSPMEAVDALLANFAGVLNREDRDYTSEPAPTGYSGADGQTWVAFRRGVPDFSIVVTQSGTTYTANHDAVCGRP